MILCQCKFNKAPRIQPPANAFVSSKSLHCIAHGIPDSLVFVQMAPKYYDDVIYRYYDISDKWYQHLILSRWYLCAALDQNQMTLTYQKQYVQHITTFSQKFVVCFRTYQPFPCDKVVSVDHRNSHLYQSSEILDFFVSQNMFYNKISPPIFYYGSWSVTEICF